MIKVEIFEVYWNETTASDCNTYTIDSATLIVETFHIEFFDERAYGILHATLTDHCVTFVKFSFSCKKHDVTATTYIVFLPFVMKMQNKLELLSNKLKITNRFEDLDH